MPCTCKMHTEDFLLKEEKNCHKSIFCLRFHKVLFSTFAMSKAFICLGLALTANVYPYSCVLQTGVAKSIIRVVQVVHLLLRTSN